MGPFLAGAAPSHGTVRRTLVRAGRSPSRSATCTTCTTSPPPSRSKADRAGRAVRGGEDRRRPGQPYPGRPGGAQAGSAAGPGTSATWTSAASVRSSRSTPRRSARTRGPHRRPTPARSTRSAGCSPSPAYARRRRWKPGHFSFNTREGQCPTCRGLGHIDLDVQYLPDITAQCPTCHGARFNDATLAVRIDGLTIADVLGLSVHEALDRFADRAPVACGAAARQRGRPGLPAARRAHAVPVRRRVAAAADRLPAAQQPARRAVRLRRAVHRPAPARRGHPGRRVRPAAGGRGHDHRDRPRPGPAAPPPTTSSTWGRAAAPTAGTSSPPARRRTSRATRAA